MNRKYRKTIVAGNWKMHKTATETKLFAERLKGALPRVKRCSIVLCVPYVDIPAAVKILKDSRVAVGAQNLHWETSGPYTGKSPPPCWPTWMSNTSSSATANAGPCLGRPTSPSTKTPRRPGRRPAPHPVRGEDLEQRELGVTLSLSPIS